MLREHSQRMVTTNRRNKTAKKMTKLHRSTKNEQEGGENNQDGFGNVPWCRIRVDASFSYIGAAENVGYRRLKSPICKQCKLVKRNPRSR